MKINRENLKWCGRTVSIFFTVGLADVLATIFLRKPLPWTAIIPAFLPLLIAVFVIIPMLRAERRMTAERS